MDPFPFELLPPLLSFLLSLFFIAVPVLYCCCRSLLLLSLFFIAVAADVRAIAGRQSMVLAQMVAFVAEEEAITC